MYRFVYSSTRLEQGFIILCCIVSGIFTTFWIISSRYFRSYHRCTTFSMFFCLLTRVSFALTNHFCFFLSVLSYELHKTSSNGAQDFFQSGVSGSFSRGLAKPLENVVKKDDKCFISTCSLYITQPPLALYMTGFFQTRCK